MSNPAIGLYSGRYKFTGCGERDKGFQFILAENLLDGIDDLWNIDKYAAVGDRNGRFNANKFSSLER